MAEIQRKVIKHSKRNVVYRHLLAKGDKDKIAAWRVDLEKIVRNFNVRSIVTVRRLLTMDSQTALAINTNVIVAETNVIVSNINRIMVGGQGGNDGRNLMVSGARSLSTAE